MDNRIVRIERDQKVISIYLDLNTFDYQLPLLLSSDVHWDGIDCQRDILAKHVKRMIALDGLLWVSGDMFDVMQGKYDKRKTITGIRPEYLGKESYYDSVVDDAIEQYGPIHENLLGFALGNHETSCIDKVGTNVIQRFVQGINDKFRPERKVIAGGYSGWIRFMFSHKGTPKGSIKMYFHHGFGAADSPVTRGVIQTNRQAVYLPDADIVHNGHNHEGYAVPIARSRLSNKGVEYRDIQWHIRTPGYKNEFIGIEGGHAIERRPRPTPAGSVFVTLEFGNSGAHIEATPWIE